MNNLNYKFVTHNTGFLIFAEDTGIERGIVGFCARVTNNLMTLSLLKNKNELATSRPGISKKNFVACSTLTKVIMACRDLNFIFCGVSTTRLKTILK